MQKSIIPDDSSLQIDLPSDWNVDFLVKTVDSIPTGVSKYEGEKEYYSTGSIQDHNISPENKYSYTKKPSRANRIASIGDVLQARMQFTNKCIIVDTLLADQLYSTGFIQVKPRSNNYNNKLLYYYLKSPIFLKQRDDYSTGSTQIALTDTGLKKIIIPIPPRDIQDLLVEKLNTYIPIVESTSKSIHNARKLLQKFRQSVLSAAVSGKLTEDWRKRNKVNTIYDKTDNAVEDIYDIPDQWKLKSIKDIALSVSTGPFGSSLHQYDYIVGGTPVINPQHIIDGQIIPSEKITVSDTTKQRLSSYVLNKGNIIIARRGEMGRCAVITSKEDGWLCGTGCFFVTLSNQILSDFFQMVFSSDISIRLLSDNSVGSTMSNLNRHIIKRHPMPLPPLEEQKEILIRIKYFMELANEIDKQIKAAENKVDKLPQSILAKAFRGEL